MTDIVLLAPDGAAVIDNAVRVLHGNGLEIAAVQSENLTLEDAFLALTGGESDGR